MEEIKNVLEKLVKRTYTGFQANDSNTFQLDQAEAEIKKIVLGWIGKNKVIDYNRSDFASCNTEANYGYNIAKDEIRESIRKGEL